MISSGVVEGFSGKAKPTGRKAYGSRTPQGIEIAMFHPMGYTLPEPKISHRFRCGVTKPEVLQVETRFTTGWAWRTFPTWN